MRKSFGALAFATLIILAGPAAANAADGDSYPPDAPPTNTVFCDVDSANGSSSGVTDPTVGSSTDATAPAVASAETAAACQVGSVSVRSADPASTVRSADRTNTVRSADLAATGMSDTALPIAAGGGLLALFGAVLMFARRRPVRG